MAKLSNLSNVIECLCTGARNRTQISVTFVPGLPWSVFSMVSMCLTSPPLGRVLQGFILDFVKRINSGGQN